MNQGPHCGRPFDRALVSPDPLPGERLLINGIAKSGTHLLAKVVSLLGFPFFPICLAADEAQRAVIPWKREEEDRLGPGIPVGVERPTLMHEILLRQTLRLVPRGHGINGHCGYSQELARLLEEEGFRVLLVLRDPRDVLVSLVHYLSKHGHSALRGLTLEEQLLMAIDGIPPMFPPRISPLRQQDVAANYRSTEGWVAREGVMTVRFEDLVGPMGGGTVDAQQKSLEALVRFLNVPFDRLDHARNNMFGGTRTFFRGRVGAWREAFTPRVKTRFKEVAGRELVRFGYEPGEEW